MIQEALDFLTNLQTKKNPLTHEVLGQSFTVKPDGTLGDAVRPVDVRFQPAALTVSTLSGLVNAYKTKVGGLGEKVALHVKSHTEVLLIDVDVDEFGKRRLYATAVHEPDTAFEFNKFHEPEKFLISFRSGFYFNEEAVKVVTLCSTVASGNAVAVTDDGVSQEVTVKSGTVTRSNVTLPSDGVGLIPWRTFRDANPVESRFLLRMKGAKEGQLPGIALFEIDAKWKLDTVNSIRSYLAGELPEATIIA